MLGKISIVGYDTVLYQRISLALWNLIMAASVDYTERCHIVFVEPMKLSVTRLLYIISHNANYTQYIFFSLTMNITFFVKIVNNSFFYFFFGK